MRFDQLARDRKPQAQTTRSSARPTIEFFKYFVFFARDETGASVSHRENQRRIVACCAHVNGRITRSMSDSIRKQRDERLFDQMCVHRNGWQILFDVNSQSVFLETG